MIVPTVNGYSMRKSLENPNLTSISRLSLLNKKNLSTSKSTPSPTSFYLQKNLIKTLTSDNSPQVSNQYHKRITSYGDNLLSNLTCSPVSVVAPENEEKIRTKIKVHSTVNAYKGQRPNSDECTSTVLAQQCKILKQSLSSLAGDFSELDEILDLLQISTNNSTKVKNDSFAVTKKTETSNTKYKNNMRYKSRINKNHFFAAIDEKLRSTTTLPPVRTFSDIVRQHPPNDITPLPIVACPLYKQKYDGNRSSKKKKGKNRKINKRGGHHPNKTISVLSNESLRNIDLLTMTTATTTNDPSSATNTNDWIDVTGKSNHRVQNIIPSTCLKPKTKYPAASIPKFTYCLTIGITPPTTMKKPVVITARLLSKVLSSFQFVCPNSQINPIDDEYAPQSDPSKLHDMDEEEILRYVWIHNTISDTYRCSFKFSSDKEVNAFKLDKEFLSWLQAEKIQIDRTYLFGQETTRIGFMLCTETRGDLIDLLEKRVRSRFPTLLKWQFDVHSCWIRSKDDVSVKVAMFRAPKLLENDIIKEFHRLFNAGRSVKFFPWNDYLELSEEQKHKIVKEQLNFQAEYRTISYSGFKDFDSALSIMDKDSASNESHKRKFVVQETQDHPNDENSNQIKTTSVDKMTILDCIISQFLTSTGERMFHNISGPTNGIMECLVKKKNFFQARKISNNTFLDSLATLIPKHRHHMVFQSPDCIGYTSQIPSKLLCNRISDLIRKQVSSDDSPIKTPPRQKQRRTSKLTVFSGYKDAVLAFEKNTAPQSVEKMKENDISINNKDNNGNNSNLGKNTDMVDKLTSLFTSFTQKIDLRISALEAKQETDNKSLLNVQTEMTEVRNSLGKTNSIINNLEVQLVNTIDIAVKGHLQQYAESFQRQMSSQIQSNSELLDKKNEDRAESFRREQKAFMEEFKLTAHKQEKNFQSMQNWFEMQHPEFLETEVTFSAQHSQATLEVNNDLSFEENHE
jgi:hypothetical protein